MSFLPIVMSTFMNFQGFKKVFLDKILASLMMAPMLEGLSSGLGC